MLAMLLVYTPLAAAANALVKVVAHEQGSSAACHGIVRSSVAAAHSTAAKVLVHVR